MATVLVVDDDAKNRMFLRTLLVHRGHEVREAADGDAAVLLAESEPPDAVITDIVMPGGLDGYELARQLRSLPATRHVPIAFSTAHYGQSEIESLARTCGVHDIILKPARPVVVLATIDALLTPHRTDPAATPDAVAGRPPDPFADEHRRALKSKLLEKSVALSRTEDWLRAVVETTRVGVVLANNDATATYVNPRLVEIAGLPVDRLLGQGWLSWLDPADRTRLRSAITAGLPATGRVYRVAARGPVAGPRWLDVRLHPTADTAASDLVAVVEDVTVAAPARPAPVESEHHRTLRTHATQLADRLAETERLTGAGGWQLDPDSQMIVVSGRLAELLELPAAMLRPEELWRRVHPDDVRRATAAAAGALRTGRTHRVGLRIVGPGGAVHQLVASCRVTVGEGAGPRGTIWGVAQDVTEARESVVDARVDADRQAEHRFADLLLRQMLPDRLPTVRGLEIAAAYRAAADRADTGGDWYDVVPVRGGAVVSVGGVAAAGRYPAAVMGSVRAVLRAVATDDPDPGRILTRLNHVMVTTYADDTYATATVVHVHAATRRLRVASAGHAPPLLLTGDPVRGGVAVGRPGVVLGVAPRVTYAVDEVTMAPDDALCLYTDGLTDRRGDGVHSDLRGLARAAVDAWCSVRDEAEPDGPPAARMLVERVMAALTDGRPHDDDACLVALAPTYRPRAGR